MQLPWDEHFHKILIPAWQSYLAAEIELTKAVDSKQEASIQQTKYSALREGGAAVFYLHHFADVVLRAKPHWLPNNMNDLRELREWVALQCTMLRTQNSVSDVSLLGDVADALKHAVLTQRVDIRDVAANEAVIVAQSGNGKIDYGERKYGGQDQVLILARSGTRALSSVLQNVVDAWRRVAKLPIPDIGFP